MIPDVADRVDDELRLVDADVVGGIGVGDVFGAA